MHDTDHDVDPRRLSAMRSMLGAHVRDEPVRTQRRRRRTVTFSVLAGTVLVGAATTAGIIVLQPSPIVDTSIAHCMSTDQRASDGSLPGSSVSLSDNFGPGMVDDAITMCSLMWSQGVFEDTFNATAAPDPDATELPVPTLQVCTASDGTAVVVPSDAPDVCVDLRLAPLSYED